MSTTSTPCAPAPPPHHPAPLLLCLLSLALRAAAHPRRPPTVRTACAVRRRFCHRQNRRSARLVMVCAVRRRALCACCRAIKGQPRMAPTPTAVRWRCRPACTIARATLFATETFSMGLNMPAKTVVFTSVRSAAIARPCVALVPSTARKHRSSTLGYRSRNRGYGLSTRGYRSLSVRTCACQVARKFAFDTDQSRRGSLWPAQPTRTRSHRAISRAAPRLLSGGDGACVLSLHVFAGPRRRCFG